MTWAVPYTVHLGLLPPDLRPQFFDTLGTNDPSAHIRYAAELGFAGVQYTWALDRPAEEVARVGAALREAGFEGGLIAAFPFAEFLTPLWTDRSAEGRRKLTDAVRRAAGLAASLNAKGLVTLIGADPNRADQVRQLEDVAANVREVAPIAADSGLVIGVEPMAARPNMLLRSTRAAVELMETLDQPNVGIVFDTALVAMMDGDLVAALDVARNHLVRIQIADSGRLEPGAGELGNALVEVVAQALAAGYNGAVDLEHGWQHSGKEGEQAGLERLQRFDDQVRAAIG